MNFTGAGAKAGFKREKVEAVIEAKGEIPVAAALRCRVRYLCDGAVFGTAEFVESVFKSKRDQLGLCREIGTREIKGGTRWKGDLPRH